MKRIAVAAAFVFSVAAIAAGSAGSATSSSAFQVFVNETASAASNGLTLNSEVAGQFDVAAKTASGDGDWSLMAGATEIDHGTFALTVLALVPALLLPARRRSGDDFPIGDRSG